MLGIVRKKALEGDGDARVDVMDPGPSTYRLDDPAHETAHHPEERGLTRAPVTTSDGELVGMFFVADALGERAGKDAGATRERPSGV